MCPLCTTVTNSADPLRIVENAAAIAVIHDDWSVRGHAMIVARRHAENLTDLTEEESAEFLRLTRAVEMALLSVFGGERVLMMKLGLAVPHLHHHLYPVSREFTRDDFFAAVQMQTRDEPSPDEVQRLLADTRQKVWHEIRR